MTKLIKVTVLMLTLGFTSLYAGSDHSHNGQKDKGHSHSHHYDKVNKGVSKKAIERASMQEVQSLVAKKKIPKSWKFVPIAKIGKTHYGDTDDWVVGFDNKQIKNKERQTLYIFVSVHGDIRGANYTGN